eukprot:1437463-Pyramimonas_sp.AAC.1
MSARPAISIIGFFFAWCAGASDAPQSPVAAVAKRSRVHGRYHSMRGMVGTPVGTRIFRLQGLP